MIKLKNLLSEKVLVKNKSTGNVYYVEKPNDEKHVVLQKGDAEKQGTGKDKPKRKPLPGIGAPPHPDSPSQKGATTKGPKSKAGALGSNPTREREIIAAVQDLVHDDRDIDLCKVSVPGTNLFCGDNKGIPRKEMPQLKSKPTPGGKADQMVKAGVLKLDNEGEVNTEKLFMKKIGKEAKPARVKVTELKATQNQLVGKKVSLFLNQYYHLRRPN